MSKHLGNGIDPIDMIEKYGADALRLSLINGMSMGTDIKYGEEKAKDAKIFINKLYNASKFVLQNLEGMKKEKLSKLELREKDRWILSELNALIKNVAKNIDKYSFGNATASLIEFTVAKFCDWYIELCKVDLYGENNERKHATQNVLLYVFENLLKLFHPFIPYVTEYIYQEIPGHAETIMRASFPKKVEVAQLSNNFDEVIEVIKAIRNARAEYNVPDNKRTSLYIMIPDGEKVIKENVAEIAKLAFGTNADIVMQEPQDKCVKLLVNGIKVFIPVGQLIDNEKEMERINKEIETLRFEISRSEKMLSNQGFIAKAPQSLVETEKQKLSSNKEKLDKLLKEVDKV